MPRAIFGATIEGSTASPYERQVLPAYVAGVMALRGAPVIRVRTHIPKQQTSGEEISPVQVGRTPFSDNAPTAENREVVPAEASRAAEVAEQGVPLPGYQEFSIVARGIRHTTNY